MGGLTEQVSRLTCSPFSPVPHNALPSDLLENVLCGVAFGLGVLGIIVGLVLIVYFRKPCSGGKSECLEWVGEPWEPHTVGRVGACPGSSCSMGRPLGGEA